MNYEEKKKELILCICLGYFGVHKFYKKKIMLGIIYLFTMGIFTFGWFCDIFVLSKELYRIKNGKKITEEDIDNIVLNNQTNKVNAIKEYRNQTGTSLKEAMNQIDCAYSRNGVNPYKKNCPRCNSENCYAFVEDKVILKGKTKTQTSINLNPLKPFTVFNHKEKVVREPWTMQVSKFICNDCGEIF